MKKLRHNTSKKITYFKKLRGNKKIRALQLKFTTFKNRMNWSRNQCSISGKEDVKPLTVLPKGIKSSFPERKRLNILNDKGRKNL